MSDILIRRLFLLSKKIYGYIDVHRKKCWQERTIGSFGAFGKGSSLQPYSNFVDPQNVFIGNNVHILNEGWFHGGGGLCFEDNIIVSRNCTIFTVSHNYCGELLPYDKGQIPKPVKIARNVWIGMNVTVIPGVTIGEGAIIGLGTVVTRDVPPLAIVGSMGARILKYRDKDHYDCLVNQGRFCGLGGVPLD